MHNMPGTFQRQISFIMKVLWWQRFGDQWWEGYFETIKLKKHCIDTSVLFHVIVLRTCLFIGMFFVIEDLRIPVVLQRDFERLQRCSHRHPNVFVLTVKEGTEEEGYTETTKYNRDRHIIYSPVPCGKSLI